MKAPRGCHGGAVGPRRRRGHRGALLEAVGVLTPPDALRDAPARPAARLGAARGLLGGPPAGRRPAPALASPRRAPRTRQRARGRHRSRRGHPEWAEPDGSHTSDTPSRAGGTPREGTTGTAPGKAAASVPPARQRRTVHRVIDALPRVAAGPQLLVAAPERPSAGPATTGPEEGGGVHPRPQPPRLGDDPAPRAPRRPALRGVPDATD